MTIILIKSKKNVNNKRKIIFLNVKNNKEETKMKIKLKSIHGNVVNDKEDYVPKNVKAHIEVGYSYNQKRNLNLNYQIKVGEGKKQFFVVKCVFEIEDYDHDIDEKIILDQAVETLQERIEIILGLISEEMGIDLQG